ncbi:MAG: NADP-dependent glyceraldehyde-3-phosphate dehydrogenase [Microscillaceae bacterium]|nr:NADP-dependent glyceraldehyde-3-phosphate dehydrogenase [Microscillaceae bacterium]
MVTQEELLDIFPKEDAIPEAYQLREFLVQNEYLINGELRYWEGPMNDILSPVCIKQKDGSLSQKLIGRTPLLTGKEALEALDAASQAYNQGAGLWPTMSVVERIQHVERFVEKMQEQRSAVVNLLMWEIGKSLKDSEKEFDRTVKYIQDTIAELKELDRKSSKFEIDSDIIAQIRRVPLGIALCMGPYNYPLNETFTTLIPALIMGNTVIFKPAKYGVLLIRPLLTAFKDCFPKGVINIIYGSGRATVGAIMETGQLNVFAFIGTNKGANDLKKMHPKPHALRSILGLDAKNPAIVLPDADLDIATDECLLGSLSFNGQRCTALKIIFVHKNVVDKFLSIFNQKLAQMKVGMPWDKSVGFTPLPEPGKCDYLKELVEDAQAHGAKVVNEHGGVIHETYFHPAVLYPVNEKMRVWREEQFGPIVPVVAFDDVQEAVHYVVTSNFGQQASIFGSNPQEIARLMDSLINQVSRININAQCQRGPDIFPFNGRKDSAEGTLSVYDALRVFSIRAIVATKSTDRNKDIIKQIIRNRESSFLSTDFIF